MKNGRYIVPKNGAINDEANILCPEGNEKSGSLGQIPSEKDVSI